jgi:signal transduction histidine kinase
VLFRSLLSGKPVDVQLDIAGNPNLGVDASLLGIVVANLVRNSFNYTDRGHVCVILDSDCLTVADTGQGIPVEALDKVFQRLYRGADSQGAGIGLSLVKKICDRYGWTIRLQSQPGIGTTAHLRFG